MQLVFALARKIAVSEKQYTKHLFLSLTDHTDHQVLKSGSEPEYSVLNIVLFPVASSLVVLLRLRLRARVCLLTVSQQNCEKRRHNQVCTLLVFLILNSKDSYIFYFEFKGFFLRTVETVQTATFYPGLSILQKCTTISLYFIAEQYVDLGKIKI